MERDKERYWEASDIKTMAKFLEFLPESGYVKYCEEEGLAIDRTKAQYGYEEDA